MKKLILIIIFTFLIMIRSSVVSHVYAQTRAASPSSALKASPTSSVINSFKEKVAEKVSKLNGDKEKAVSGYITKIDTTSLTVQTEDKIIHTIDLDDTLTQYYAVQGTVLKTIKKDTLEKNDYIFATGPEINGAIQANGIYTDTRYSVISGKISEADTDNYTIKIVTQDKTTYTFDIQTRTSQELLDIKSLDTNKVGFSKLKIGDEAHVVYKTVVPVPSSNRYDAEKILIIPNEYFLQ